MTELATWLQELGLQEYHQKFVDQGITWDRIRSGQVTTENLTSLGVKRGHLSKLSLGIKTASGGKVVAPLLSSDPLNVDNCWNLLNESMKLSSYPFLASVCWNFIIANVKQVLDAPGFVQCDENILHTLLLRDDLNIDEDSLIVAVATWYESNPHGDIKKLADTIRVGTLSIPGLLFAEKVPWIDRLLITQAWKVIACRRENMKAKLPNLPDKFSISRVIPNMDHTDGVQFSAKHASYVIECSSVYSQFNKDRKILTAESLIDAAEPCGIATNYEASPDIRVTFPYHVTISQVIIGIPSGGLFSSLSITINNIILETSDDDFETFKEVGLISGVTETSGDYVYTLNESVKTKCFRLRKAHCYLGVLSLDFK